MFDFNKLFADNNYMNFIDDMNERVSEYKTKIYGFDKELDTLYHSLNRYKKHNVLLIGKAGVGKTALVEKFCQLINENKVPAKYKNKKVYELSLNALLCGTKYRGEFEEKVQTLLDEFTNNPNTIIFIDEIHNIMGLGDSKMNGSMAFSETLKPYLARNKLTIIGATTEKEYKKYIKSNDAFDRRFSKIYIDEPNLKTTYEILKSMKKEYENYYGIFLRDNELKQVISKTMFRRGNNPDKALDVLEDLCYEKSKDNE